MKRKAIYFCLGLGIALVAALTTSRTSSASSSGTLKNTSHAAQWSGTVTGAAAPSGEVPECAQTPCDRFDLIVDLPGVVRLINVKDQLPKARSNHHRL